MTKRRIKESDYKIYELYKNDYCDYFRLHKHLTDKIQLECVMDINNPTVYRCYLKTRCHGFVKRKKGERKKEYEMSTLFEVWNK